jgi:hypothetical protein
MPDLNPAVVSDAPPPTRYRAVSASAVGSIALGMLALLTFLHWAFAAIPLLAIAAGWWALRQIERRPEELTGVRLAWTGICLALGFWLLGTAWLVLVGSSEVPMGYERIDYAELQPDYKVSSDVPKRAADLENKRVYVKGYMMPMRQQSRLKKFIICPTNGTCQYCTPNPKPTEMIRVKLGGDTTMDYTSHLIGVGGLFHIEPNDRSGVPYSMEVDYVW